ncbi:hypothetical protein HOA56_00035 [archaeon]|jgi:hypothetical protein|nr:hypothetical protein [archaeon]MBT6820789.1 hypothetical protein [archaeon]
MITKKRGVLVIQFNWMYVMVIGAVIIIFFVMLANNIRKNSNESLNFDILNYMDEIFVGIETSSQVEHSINLPGVDLRVDCQGYTIKNSRHEGKSLKNRIVFSPDLLTKEIVSYTLYFEAPFKTSFFLFLTSKQMQYVPLDDDLTDSESYANQLVNELPENLNLYYDDPETKEMISEFSDYEEDNHYKIKFIMFDTDPDDSYPAASIDKGKTKNRDISLIVIDPNEDTFKIDEYDTNKPELSFPDGSGEVKFYTYNGEEFVRDDSADEVYPPPAPSFGYLNKATLFGAIYSQDAYNYDCNMAKGLKRLSLMSEMLNSRIEHIEKTDEDFNDLGECSGFYEESKKLLYDSGSEGTIQSIANRQDISEEHLNKLFDFIYENGLVFYNDELQQKSCPMIY